MAWLKINTPMSEKPSPSMIHSLELHEKRLREISLALGLREPLLFEREFCHTTLPVCGRPDIVSGEPDRVVVEYKPFRRESDDYRDFEAQLLAYAWLVQEVLGRVRRILLVVDNSVRLDLDYSFHEFERGERIVKELLRLVGSDPPQVEFDGRCTYCFYNRLCWSSASLFLIR